MTSTLRLFLRELQRAPRTLLRTPGFAVSVIAVFALGIGVSTTMWSAVHALLLQPLPFAAPERLAALYQQSPEDPRRPLSPANFLDFRRLDRQLAGIAAWTLDLHVVTGGVEPRRLDVAWVSSNFFDLLGTRAASGRLFHTGEQGTPALISEQAAAELGGVHVGQVLRVDDASVQVVGVAPRSLDYPPTSDLWVLAPRDIPPLGLGVGDLTTLRDARYLGAVARLAPGATLASAQSELDAVARRLAADFPEANANNGAVLVPLGENLGAAGRRPLLLLLGAAALVLVVGCLNVAGLLLARAARRRQSLALQAALGAGRAAMLAPALAETLTLAIAGAGLAVGLARWAGPRLLSALPQAELGGREIAVSLPVLGFAVAAALVAGVLAAVLPAFGVSFSPAALLRNQRSAGPGRDGTRTVLVVAQVALAFVLVAGAGLLLRTVHATLTASPGFRSADVVTVRLALPSRSELSPAARRALMSRAVALAASSPGVIAAGGINKLPLAGLGIRAGAHVEGREYGPNEAPDLCWRAVEPGYFTTMGIPLVRGRALGDADGGEARTALVNRRLAALLWPGADPIGKHLRTGLDGDDDLTVVGVVADTPQESLDKPAAPEIYRPLLAETRWGAEVLSVVVRTGPGFSPDALRRTMRGASPLLVVETVRPAALLVSEAAGARQLLAALLALFGGAALLLASVGLYALLTLLVAERRRELAVRLAVGAEPKSLALLVVRRGVGQVALGATLGLLGALGLLRVLSAWLFAVEPWDPASLAGSLAVLLVTALLAAALPALRAARVPPATTLRDG